MGQEELDDTELGLEIGESICMAGRGQAQFIPGSGNSRAQAWSARSAGLVEGMLCG